ncbi:hypothetical protein NDK25_26375 [Niallia taxi]|uniref:hypothetical protein n=1 Tax=Niallia taxi TaxID=2499688 RepID=UPI001C92D217|nr:hypothetical protein [Niallia taxi]MCT2345180.1 hypothetical protein [Niallia taxi]MDE5055739.1 hypothetical protein [Niallia taxi]MED3961424.1 hypothetical protein [Niallia taxi]
MICNDILPPLQIAVSNPEICGGLSCEYAFGCQHKKKEVRNTISDESISFFADIAANLS